MVNKNYLNNNNAQLGIFSRLSAYMDWTRKLNFWEINTL